MWLTETSEPTKLDELVATAKKGAYDSLTAQIALREAYESTMGFNDYDLDSTSPLNLVVDSASEDVNTETLLTRYIDRYHRNCINKHFGVSFVHFMDLPFFIAEELLERALKVSVAEHNLMAGLANELEGKS